MVLGLKLWLLLSKHVLSLLNQPLLHLSHPPIHLYIYLVGGGGFEYHTQRYSRQFLGLLRKAKYKARGLTRTSHMKDKYLLPVPVLQPVKFIIILGGYTQQC